MVVVVVLVVRNIARLLGICRRGHNEMTHWLPSHSCEPRARAIADRHYNRQKPGSSRFVPPGMCMVLMTGDEKALWVTSWPFGQYVKHAWAGAWVNSCFRNEGYEQARSSELIREAVAVTRGFFEAEERWRNRGMPELGMITFVDAGKVRHKRDPGRCYRKAGFKHVGFTKAGLWAFQMLPAEMPATLPWPRATIIRFEDIDPLAEATP